MGNQGVHDPRTIAGLRELRDARPVTHLCPECGVPLAPGAACFRCAFKKGDATGEDREVHQRAMRRAVFELRATMTWGPR